MTDTDTNIEQQVLPHYIMKEIQERVELDLATGKQELVTIVVMEQEQEHSA